MRFLLWLGLLGILALLQSTVLDFVRIAGVKPDIVLVLVVFHAILHGSREGAYLGFLGGLMVDLVSGFYFGFHAVTYTAAGYTVGLLEWRLYRESSIIVAIVAFAATVGQQLLAYLLLLALQVPISPGLAIARVVLPIGLYNGVVAILSYRTMAKLDRRGLLKRPM